LIRDSFIKVGRETKSPFITNPFRFAGVQWATALTNWLKRKPLIINGAAKTPTFEDDFSSSTGWTQTGTSVTVSSGIAGGTTVDLNSDDRIDKSITTISDSIWTSYFDFKLNSFSNSADTSFTLLSINDGTGDLIAGDALIVQCAELSSTPQVRLRTYLSGTANVTSSSITINLTQTYYGIVRRLSTTEYDLRIFSDSARTTQIGSTTLSGANANVGGFDNVGTGATLGFGNASDTANYTLDNVEIYNGITTVENIPSQQTATLEDDFSGTDDWADQGSGVGVNTTTDRLEFSSWTDNTTNNSSTLDLGSALSDTDWTIRFKLQWTGFSNTTDWTAPAIGMFSADSATGGNSAQDMLFYWGIANGATKASYLSSADNSTVSGTDTNLNYAWVLDTTYYIELQRDGSNFSATIWTGSYNGTEVASGTDTIGGTVSGLRYFGAKSPVTNRGGSFTGWIDDVQVWDNFSGEINPTTLTDYPVPIKIIGDTNLQRKTAETRDEPFTADGWVDTGSNYGVDITNEVLNWNATDSSANNGSAYDLTSVSNSAWTLDFDLFSNVTAGADATANVTHFGISGESQATAETTSQDYIGMRIKRGSTVNEIAIIQSENPTAPSGGTSSAFTLTAQDLDGKTVFVRIQRLSTTAGAIMIFADSAHTILLERKDLTLPSGLDTLRYLRVFSGATQDSTENSTLNGTVKNLKFWNGITNPVTQETPTLDDNFTSDNFNDTGTKIGVANNTLEWDGAQNGSVHGSTIDLTSIDTKAVFRAKLRINTLTAPSSASSFILIGFSDSDHTTAGDSSQDGIGLIIQNDSDVTNTFRAMHVDGASFSPNAGTAFATVPATATDYFIEVVLDVNTWYVRIYSDSDYSTLTEEETGSLTATGLRYFGIKMRSSASVGGTFDGYIDDLQFWNGISSPNATGRKFVFTNDAFDGNAVEYASETTSYDPINGDWTGYVKIPSLTAGADTTIQMYYDYSASNPSYVPELFTSMPTADSVFGVNGDQVIEDCTTYANTTEGDADYVPSVTGTNECRLNPSTDVIDCRFEDNSADHFVAYRDLTGTTITDNAWTLRCKVATTVITAPSGGLSHSVYIGMSDNTSNFATSQDFLGISFWNPGASASPNTPKHYAVYRDSAIGGMSNQAPAASSVVFSTAWTNTDTYYIEIIRVSDTKLTVELFNDSAYTTSVEKQTVSVPSTVTGLRYFKAGVYDNANVVGFTMTIDDLEFWEGVNKNREQSTYDSNYKAVYHLQGNSTDSTAYGNDGTDTSVDWEQQNNSVGLVADGANTKVDSGSDTSVDDMLDNGGHVSVWINPKSDGEGSSGRIIGKGSGWFIETIGESGGFVKLEFTYGFDTTDAKWETAAIVPINTLTKVDVYYNDDGSSTPNPTMWINGLKYTVDNGGLTETSTGSTSSVSDASGNLIIGNNSGSTLTFDGLIDEARVSDKQRLSSEVITTYNAEKSDSDIITTGNELTQ
jgi:hypothetical protein